MKKIITYSALAMVVLLLAGCTVTPADEPSPTLTTTGEKDFPIQTINPEINPYLQYMPKGQSIEGYTVEIAQATYSNEADSGAVITTVEEYQEYLAKNQFNVMSEGDKKVQAKVYDEKFFAENALLTITLHFNSGSITPVLRGIVTVSDTIYVGYTAQIPTGAITTDMSCRILLVSIPKTSLKGETKVSISNLTEYTSEIDKNN